MTSASGKGAFTTAAMTVIRSLRDPVEQDHYLAKIAQLTDTTRDALTRKLSSVSTPEQHVRQVKPDTGGGEVTKPSRLDRNQDTLLAVALYDTTIQSLFASISPTVFNGTDRQAIAAYIIKHIGKPITSVPKGLEDREKYVTMLLLHPDVDNVDWNSETRAATAKEVLRSLNANYQKTNTKEELLRQESEARERGDETAAADILRQLSQLIKGEK